MGIVRESATGDVSTRERLLDTAERLFAERGYKDTCIRDVTEAAGVNVAAVNYHFQGKENLYLEVFRRRIGQVGRLGAAALDELASGAGPVDLGAVLEVFVRRFFGAHLAAGADSTHFMNLVLREVSSPGPAFELVVREMLLPVRNALGGAIRRARPQMSEEDVWLSVASIVGQIIHFVRARRVITFLMDRPYDAAFVERIVRHVTRFSLAGIDGVGA